MTSVRTKLAALDESAARIAAERAEIAEALTGASDEIATLANVDDLRGEAYGCAPTSPIRAASFLTPVPPMTA